MPSQKDPVLKEFAERTFTGGKAWYKMGTFSSGTGLISGFDIEGYVTQIMAIESRNKTSYETRVEDNSYEQETLKAIQTKIMTVQLKAANFNTYNTFENKTASSSDEDAMTATAQNWATRGSYQFVVKSLATNHQIVTRNSFSSRDETVGSGTISFEIGQGQLARDTDINQLNGRTGVQRGKIEITDKSGTTDTIDLTTALSVNDVLKAINSSKAGIKASVSGDGIVIEDLSGGAGNLIVSDIGDGQTAKDLGIRQTTSASKFIGEDIVSLSRYSLLKELNDGNGIRDLTTAKFNIQASSTPEGGIDVSLSDKLSSDNTLQSLNSGAGVRLGKFEITDRNNKSVVIDLSDNNSFDSISIIKEKIESEASEAGLDLTVNFDGRSNIQIKDNSKPLTGDDGERRSNLIINDLEGGSAAGDLGIEANVSSSTINGDTVWKMETLADVMAAINYNSQNYKDSTGSKVTVSIDPDSNQLKVVDNNGGIFSEDKITITAGEDDGMAASDLGLLTGEDGIEGSEFQGKALVAGLNTVLLSSLNGGSGGDPDDENYGENRITSGGIISIKDGSGSTAVEVDLTNAVSVQDVIDAINEAGTNITAGLNSVGNGITLKDASGTGQMEITDVTGNLAEKLNLTGTAVSEINSGNLQLQYISEATLLKDMRNGEGITRGSFTVTDSNGVSKEIDLSQDSIKTVGDLINAFTSEKNNIRAKINNTGDGIILYDNLSTGSLTPIKIEDNSAGTARDLGLLAKDSVKDENGNYYLDGSYELTLNLGGSDSLNDISNMINDAGLGIDSSVVYDGIGYHLSFSSETSGRKGTIHFDAGDTEMAVDNITSAKDAIILLGDGSEDHAMLISNNTNSIKDAILGTTLELKKVSSEPITINIGDDVDNMVEELTSFIDSYNEALNLIAENTQFNTDTYEKGLLFSDHTTGLVKNQLLTLIQHTFSEMTGNYRSFASIGISFTQVEAETNYDDEGNEIITVAALNVELDEDAFRSAFEDDADAVTALFSTKNNGISDYVSNLLENLASSGIDNSTMQNRIDAISNENRLLDDRIEDLEERLSDKEARLYSQFYAMEETLAKLQSQQTSIAGLGSQ